MTVNDDAIGKLLDEINERINPLPKKGEDPREVEKRGLHRAAFHEAGSPEECLGCWITAKTLQIRAYLENKAGPMVDMTTGKVIDVIPEMQFPELVELGPGEALPPEEQQ